MNISSIIGLIDLYKNNWVLSFFIKPQYWQWGYKHITPNIFPYWEYKSFSLGPLFSLHINLTDMEKWFELKNPN